MVYVVQRPTVANITLRYYSSGLVVTAVRPVTLAAAGVLQHDEETLGI